MRMRIRQKGNQGFRCKGSCLIKYKQLGPRKQKKREAGALAAHLPIIPQASIACRPSKEQKQKQRTRQHVRLTCGLQEHPSVAKSSSVQCLFRPLQCPLSHFFLSQQPILHRQEVRMGLVHASSLFLRCLPFIRCLGLILAAHMLQQQAGLPFLSLAAQQLYLARN